MDLKTKIMSLILSFLMVLSLLVTACTSTDTTDEDILEEDVITEETTPPETTETTPPETDEIILPEADIIFINGQIITMESDIPRAEAIAISGDIIAAVGNNEEILTLCGPETNIVDLDGLTLLPGFVDTHTHMFGNLVDVQGYTLEEVQEEAFKDGTTTIGEMMKRPHVLDQVIELEQQGGLRLRTSMYLNYMDYCGIILGDWYKDYPIVTDPTRMLRIIGIKLFADGGGCNRPAYSFEIPENLVINDPMGDLYLSEEEFTSLIIEFQEAGYQVATHAIGDRAIEMMLNAIEAALDGQPNTYRHRIEHCTTIRPDLLSRFGEIGVVAIIMGGSPACIIGNPNIIYGALFTVYPDTYPYWYNPVRQLLDANPGLHAAWHTDRPPIPQWPIKALFCFATAKAYTPDGTICDAPDWQLAKAITAEEALRMMTIEGAYALFMEDYIGSLKPGKFADLIVLSKNLLIINPEDIMNIEVLLTMVGGNVEYYASGYEALCPAKP